ncbi:hypothetical protein SAMN04487989_102404 [Bizionia echini]|uniref:Uncharacterized protein n=1 Tax=Bizionia echini TaxID=649333 RepID=A0A1I5B0C7_9FLAO|nr:hypothetical protein [Bizionia echini]SFN68163.1 hypothetical protein SAMN04487989_102404 [Bizionia echini]
MKKVSPKVLYLLSSALIVASIFFKENTATLYYACLIGGLAAFLLGAVSHFRN